MERESRSSPADDQLVVLFVDDEPEVLSAVRRCLRHEPYEIITVGGADEALDWLRKTPVDLVLTDERMPSKTGTQLLREIRERSPGTCRGLFSAYPSEAFVGSGLEAGADVFIYKPWDERYLRATVRGLLQRKASNPAEIETTGRRVLLQTPVDVPFDLGGEGG